jgi:hypothetical protein
MKNKKIIVGVVAAVLLGAGFGGGYATAKLQTPAQPGFGNFPNGQGTARTGAQGLMRTNGGFVSGEILSKDAGSITVKMQDGSTKIILIGASAQVLKSTQGSGEDLVAGVNVTVTGSINSDGSITAQSVQIRPAGIMPIGSTTPRQ